MRRPRLSADRRLSALSSVIGAEIRSGALEPVLVLVSTYCTVHPSYPPHNHPLAHLLPAVRLCIALRYGH